MWKLWFFCGKKEPAAAQKLGYALEKGTNSIKLIKNLK